MKNLIQKTDQQVNQGLPIYQGPRVADFDPREIAGMNQIAGTVPQQTAGVTAAFDANNAWLNPNLLNNVGNVPGVQGMRQTIQDSVGEMLTRSLLPNIRSNAIAGDSLGGSRQGVAEGLAGGEAAGAVAEATNALDYRVWEALLGQQRQSINAASGLATDLTRPGQALLDTGKMQRMMEQAKLEAEQAKFKETANAPYFGLDQLRSTLGAGQTGQTTTQNPGGTNWLNVLLGAGLLYNSVKGP
jgi:hypothetical protein